MDNIDNGVSLAATPAEQPGVSIAAPSPTQPNLPEDTTLARAAKISEGLGEHIEMDYDSIIQEMKAGREHMLRDAAASKLNADNYQRKLGMVADLANKSDKPLDENEVRAILDPFNPANRPLDPNSIVEREFSKKYIGSLQDAVDSTKSVPLTQAQQEIPATYNETLQRGDRLTAKLQTLQTMEEDYTAAQSRQGVLGNAADFAKNLIQPYVELKFRGNIGYTSGLGLGSALRNKANEVFAIDDLDAFGKEARLIGDSLAKDNPSLALQWVEYLKGNGNVALDNLFTGLMPIDYVAIPKGAAALVRRVDLNRRTNQAVRQMVEASERVGANQAKRAEAAGDLSTAGETRATELIGKDIAGARDPIELTKEPLLTNLRQDSEKLATDTGNLSGEQVRRIQDQYESNGTSLIQRIIDSVRINRTPMAVATREAIQKLKEAAADFFPGIKNAILDVSDPLYEPRSNTYWHEVSIGNFDGTLFSNAKTAEEFAKLHGLNPNVVQASGPVTNAKIQQLLTQRVKLARDLDSAASNIETHTARSIDEKLTPKERDYSAEQARLFAGEKKAVQKKLDETDLRLKGGSIYDRVTGLQNEIDQLRSTNKQLRSSLKDNVHTAENRERINESMRWAKRQILEKNEEIAALRSGKAETLDAKTDTVQQHGVGFKIVLRRPMVETDHAVRDLLIRDASGNIIPEAVGTSSSSGFKGLLNAALWRFRGADDTLAINESIQRKIGTYTQSLFKQWASEEAGYIRQLASGTIRQDPVTGAPIPYWKAKPLSIYDKITGKTRATYNDFVRTLEYARTARDKDGNVGYFFQTPGELNDFYQRTFQREASFPEHQAYFAFTRMVEGDRIFREISEFRNRARLGMEQFQLKVKGPGNTTNTSDWFDARRLKKFPGGDDVLMILGRRNGDEKLINLGGAGLSPTALEKLREDVEQGRKTVLELYAPEHTPFRGFLDKAGNEHIRYVVTDSAASKPIEFNHVNRRGGGHFEYDYDNFLKQAKMYHQYENVGGVQGKYRSVYTGDTTFMPLLNREMGQDIANKMHEVQRLIREGDLEGAKNYTEANLPIEWDKLHSMFKPGRDELGRQIPPMLDLNERFVVTPRGKTVLDMDADLAKRHGGDGVFKNSATSGSLNKQFTVAYNTERDSEGIKHFMDVGTPGNPVYKYAPETKFIDPITTMNRSLNRIVQTVFMDDYKMYAVEHWLREAEEHLEPLRAKLARTSPFWVFTSSIDKSAFRGGTPWETVQNLLSNRYKIQQFTGVPSTFDTALHSAKQTLVDWSYRTFGSEETRSAGAKALLLIPNWAVGGGIKDPVSFLRSMTFHEKLGLFNPAQMLVQAQTFATILAMSPKNGAQGTVAALFHGWSRMNRAEENIAMLGRKAEAFGWKPGEFKEAMEHGENTGFFNVAGEYANLNTALKTDFVGNDFKSLLHAGTWFFRQGEQSTRIGAWYTAFREFRDANPVKAITRDDVGKILQRADLLTANMSRASNSVLQSGVLSLTSQFLTYQMRLAEMMLGNRLTAMEKTRMLAFYAALYGAPSAVGLYGLPLTNSIREEAINRGYVVGDNWLTSAVDQGLPAIAAAIITGKGDFRKGNNYNLGARYGSPGFTQLADAMKSDAPWWQLLAGASGTALINTLSSTNSFFHAMASQAFRPNGEKPFPLQAADFVDMAKEITSVNQGWKIYMAINTGKWMSKNEGYIGDTSVANAVFMGALGLSPQQQDDMYLKKDIRKREQEYQKYVMAKAIEELQRGYENQKQNNWTAGAKNFTRAQTLIELGGFPSDQVGQIYSASLKNFESMIDDMDYKMASDKVPELRNDFMGIPMPFSTQGGVANTRMNQYKTQLQLNQYKNGK